MNRDQQQSPARRSDLGDNVTSLANGFLDYLRTRSPEAWLFLAVGIILGLLIG